MTNNGPLISIGLPVFNGENYLRSTIESVLAQTYKNFELIIADNMSTDKTREICQEYAVLDHRIHYVCNSKNIGVTRNFNHVFELSKGEYFKWWAYDDLCAPEYIERCLDILIQHSDVILCHSVTVIIDENGKRLGEYYDLLHFRSKSPHIRFRNYLFRPAAMWNAIYGVVRAKELRKTPLHGNYRGSDRVLLGELVLRGEVHQVQEPLFMRRSHPKQMWRSKPTLRKYLDWFDPDKRISLYLPRGLKNLIEYHRAVSRIQLPMKEQLWCYFFLGKWALKQLIRYFYKPLKRILS